MKESVVNCYCYYNYNLLMIIFFINMQLIVGYFSLLPETLSFSILKLLNLRKNIGDPRCFNH